MNITIIKDKKQHYSIFLRSQYNTEELVATVQRNPYLQGILLKRETENSS